MDEKIKVDNKCPICGRPTHKESEYCIFHASKEEKNEKEFEKKLIEYINDIKKNNKEYDFIKFIFVGNINFRKDLNIKILSNSDFRFAIFLGAVSFEKVIFEGKTRFQASIFNAEVCFSNTIFKGKTSFSKTEYNKENMPIEIELDKLFDKSFIKFPRYMSDSAIFKRNVYFDNAVFEGETNFIDVKFNGTSDFSDTLFNNFTTFEGAIFEKGTSFCETRFNSSASFRDAIFKEDSLFIRPIFMKEAMFEYTQISPIGNWILKVKKRGIIFFENAFLENVTLDLNLGKNALVNFSNALLRGTKIKKSQIENHIQQEKENNFLEAREVYILLKNNFHTIGNYDDESWAYIKERDMERFYLSFYNSKEGKSFVRISDKKNFLSRIISKAKYYIKWLLTKKSLRYFKLFFSNFIYQYGENPWRVIRFAAIIVFVFAIIFRITGITLNYSLSTPMEYFREINENTLILKYVGPILGDFWNCMYFSTVTFTTLGLGDFHPVESWGRIFVGTEAFIGAFMMALFVYTFARRTGGR